MSDPVSHTADNRSRCGWPGDDEAMLRYHDEEWGVPVHADGKWFEYLLLDSFQAGLSWKTVLHKREGLREVFYDFDPERVAGMTEAARKTAMLNAGIIRNRLKIEAAVKNASAFLKLQEREGTFDSFIWSFTGGKIIQNSWKTLSEIPASTTLSDRVSRALKEEGFTFVGSTICYAFLQAGGIVNDHLTNCFRHKELLT